MLSTTVIPSSSLLLLGLQLWVARQKATALHLIAAAFENSVSIDSSSQIGLIVLFRDFDDHVFTIVFNYRETNGLSVDCSIINFCYDSRMKLIPTTHPKLTRTKIS